MTTAEIKALVDESQHYRKHRRELPTHMVDELLAAIETLLARRAEVLARVGTKTKSFCYECQEFADFDADYYCKNCEWYDHNTELKDAIRAILNPENET